MSENKNENTNEQVIRDRSRKRRKSSGAGWLFLLIPLILILGTALFFAGRYGLELYKNKAETEAVSEAAPVADREPAPGGDLFVAWAGAPENEDFDICIGENCETSID